MTPVSLKLLRYIALGASLTLVIPLQIQAQDDEETTFPLENFYAKRKKWPRSLLRNFHLGLSTAYGTTFFSHKLSGYGIFQRPGYAPRIFPAGPTVGTRYANWVNTTVPDTLSVQPGSFLVSSDSAKIGFKGRSLNIPLKGTIHYEFDRYRIGGGYSYEFMSIGDFHAISFKDSIKSFRPGTPNGFMRKYFGMLGVSFYRLNEYLLTFDANIGGFKPGKNFNMPLIKKGVYVNLGVTAEREFSEYLKVFLRPSFEIKNYTLNVPEGSAPIVHHINAFYLNLGVSYRIPDLPKCYHKDCRAQLNHAHGNREYRSRVHPIYKKQNPMYGENYPRLFKYKRKNRKKLNPY